MSLLLFIAVIGRYDKHVVPEERVTDFRTVVSGVEPRHLRNGVSLRTCRNEVAALTDDKILVGHALHNDLKVVIQVLRCSDLRLTSIGSRLRRNGPRVAPLIAPQALVSGIRRQVSVSPSVGGEVV